MATATMATMATTATMAMMAMMVMMTPNSNDAASGDESNEDTKQWWWQQRQRRTMGIVNPLEAITMGDVVVPRMPPLPQRPHRDDAFIIIQSSPTGLTPQRNTWKIRTKKIWTAKKIWIGWPANRSRFVTKWLKRGREHNWTRWKKNSGTKILLNIKKSQTHEKSNYGRHPVLASTYLFIGEFSLLSSSENWDASCMLRYFLSGFQMG
jgi:hypothetical protein